MRIDLPQPFPLLSVKIPSTLLCSLLDESCQVPDAAFLLHRSMGMSENTLPAQSIASKADILNGMHF